MGYLEDGNGIAGEMTFDKNKANILLIGDSIRMGYCEMVREELKDIANVFYPEENCRNTQYVITRLYSWSKEFPADQMHIVQFNCGHWDVAHWDGYEEPLTSPDEYRRNLRMIIQLLRKLFPKAMLVFATTTVMNPDGTIGRNPRCNEEIAQYNRIAVELAETESITVNDLNAVSAAYGAEMFRDYCHLTEDAANKLAGEVAGFIRRMICEIEEQLHDFHRHSII